ncbi:unnamed protein product [Paramecium pentaurelia]|uniref:Uncharacterized protein n=1 Tax=Paramecium pentaurelia TaxID=43138 RepID=A0A8S1YH05_9CILI|nr:unnamed protein product [Paramecium pentaurelia]
MNQEFNEKSVYNVFIYHKMNNQLIINEIYQRFNYLNKRDFQTESIIFLKSKQELKTKIIILKVKMVRID